MRNDNVTSHNAAALAAFKKRQDNGEVEFVHTDSPLLEAARGDPDVAVIDMGWLDATFRLVHDCKQQSVFAVCETMVARRPGGDTSTNRVFALHDFLRMAEASGLLVELQQAS
ncbi:hypothetical protein [Pseudomonas fluorescens]|uniref:Uncharacterized protein n=1 Tax=Pseudomonas fluorescens TaxID=294 RepID=A0A5E7FNQ0_PSEFL|nr:hypothetical protein [Pseudomonas fluorescens]VVO40855.1 hypothetical protein PS691_05728 [Pseudomonas fluorescens]